MYLLLLFFSEFQPQSTEMIFVLAKWKQNLDWLLQILR